ncbi:MAG: hypothetical protein ACE5KE_00230 [Methanosarcinales archaeon]
MIRKIQILFRDTGVWARGETYPVAPIVKYKDKQVVFSKTYARGTNIRKIWREIRNAMTDVFFDIFYPAVIWQTAMPKPAVDIPEIALKRQTEHIREKQVKLPEFYEWDSKFKKWHMTREGYETRTKTLGGPIDIAVATGPFEDMFGSELLDILQSRFSGKTMSVVLFVFPDRYDEEVRAMFELKVTFW